MSRRPQNYQALREEHARAAAAALDQHVKEAEAPDPQKSPDQSGELAKEPEPTRPTFRGWASTGGMVEQQTSAMQRLEAEAATRAQVAAQNVPDNAERSAAAALDQHIDGQGKDAPEQVAAAEALDRQAAGQEQGVPEPNAATAALDRQIESQEQAGPSAEFKDTAREVTAREVLDRHIESPEPPPGPAPTPEPEITQSPEIDV